MNRERLQELRNVIAGIPEEQIELHSVFRGDWSGTGEPPMPCGAVACIAGWALMYPPFVDAGIRKLAWFGTDKCARFFGVNNDGLFSKRTSRDGAGTDKEVALRRLDKLLDDDRDTGGRKLEPGK